MRVRTQVYPREAFLAIWTDTIFYTKANTFTQKNMPASSYTTKYRTRVFAFLQTHGQRYVKRFIIDNNMQINRCAPVKYIKGRKNSVRLIGLWLIVYNLSLLYGKQELDMRTHAFASGFLRNYYLRIVVLRNFSDFTAMWYSTTACPLGFEGAQSNRMPPRPPARPPVRPSVRPSCQLFFNSSQVKNLICFKTLW